MARTHVSNLPHLIPPKLLSLARFAIILRDPVARLLSMYNNNAAWLLAHPLNAYERKHPPKLTNHTCIANTSFAAFANCTIAGGASAEDGSMYADFIDSLTEYISRSQLLVLSYADVVYR